MKLIVLLHDQGVAIVFVMPIPMTVAACMIRVGRCMRRWRRRGGTFAFLMLLLRLFGCWRGIVRRSRIGGILRGTRRETIVEFAAEVSVDVIQLCRCEFLIIGSSKGRIVGWQ